MKTPNSRGCRVEIDHTVLNMHLFSADPLGNRSLRTRLRIDIDSASKIIAGIQPDVSDFADDNEGH